MKKSLKWTVFWLGTVWVGQGVADVTLQQCVEESQQNHPTMMEMAARLNQANALYQQATSSRLPKITASLHATYSNHPLNAFGMTLSQREATYGDLGMGDLGNAGFGGSDFDLGYKPDVLNHPDPQLDLNPRIEVLLPIYNGGKLNALQTQAKAFQQSAREGNEAAKQTLAFYVFQAYEAIHTADAYLQVTEQGVKAAKSYVKTTESLWKQGVVVKSQLMQAKVHLSEVELMQQEAANQKALAQAQLQMLMASKATVTVAQSVRLPAETRPLSRLKSLVQTQNLTLQAKQAQWAMSTAKVKAVQADQGLSINGLARLDSHDDGVEFDEPAYTLGAVVSYPLTDFGVRQAAVEAAEAESLVEKAKLDQLKAQLLLDVETAYLAYRKADVAIEKNRLAVTAAEEVQRLSTSQYRNGVITLTELLANEASLNKARADHLKALYDYKVNIANIHLLLGELNFDELLNE